MLVLSAADNLTVTLPQTSCCVKQNQNRGNGNGHFIYIQGVPGRIARLWESVPYVKVYRYNPKHLYPKLNGYGDNGQRSLKL